MELEIIKALKPCVSICNLVEKELNYFRIKKLNYVQY